MLLRSIAILDSNDLGVKTFAALFVIIKSMDVEIAYLCFWGVTARLAPAPAGEQSGGAKTLL